MALKEEAAVLLSKEMDRKDFLKYIGVGIVAMTGVSTLIRAMTPSNSKQEPAANGYGSSPYGGLKK